MLRTQTDNIYSIAGGASFDFAIQMSNAAFMFTKNFNSKINCSFNPSVAALVAPDSATAKLLLNFARYEFDLAELYARILRKRIFEEKALSSSLEIFNSLYDEVHSTYAVRRTIAIKQTDLGLNEEKLKELHQEVLLEIHELNSFCKNCKPPKKSKTK